MALVVGSRLGPYEVLSLIGAGSMGEVYQARDTRLDRKVAVKVLAPELAADDEFRVRFERDAPSAPTVEGSYILNLATTTGQVVSTLPVSGFGLSSELLLWAQVKDSSGGLASGGIVILQVCKLKGSYAPSAECDSGAGTWSHFATERVAAGSCLPFAPETGNVCITFGAVSAPRTIGFRYRYIGQGTGIASDESESKDMTWVAVP